MVKTNRSHRGLKVGVLALLSSSSAVAVHAQTQPPQNAPVSTPAAAASPGVLPEVIVTAQRRSERLQNVPISIVVLGEEKLKQANIISTEDLGQLTPGLAINRQGAYAQPRIRGIGTIAISPALENPVALYIDGVYIGGQAGSTMALNDIQQVEVDKGPQGTLFGRNATGGLIQITTRDPRQTFGWSGSATYGDYDTYGADLYLTGGVANGLSASISGFYLDQSHGFGRNEVNNQYVNTDKEAALRNKWLWQLTSKTTIRLGLDYEQSTGSPVLLPAPGTTPLAGTPYTGPPLGADSFYQPYSSSKRGGASLRIDQDLGFANLMSLTSYRESRTRLIYDDLIPDPSFALLLDKQDNNEQATQEFQLQSPAGSKLKWTVGSYLYYFDGRNDPLYSISPGLDAPIYGVRFTSSQKTYSAAGFAQGSYPVTSDTDLTLGIRYTSEEKKEDGYIDALVTPTFAVPAISARGEKTFSQPTWRASLDHHFNSDIMGYVSYNRGFKSGGFNDGSTVTFKPETLDAYEAGIKSQAFDRLLTTNVSGFYYVYKNIQTVRYTPSSPIIYNGSGAHIYGVDADISANIGSRLVLTAGGELLHTEYTSFLGADRSIPLPGGGTEYVQTNPDGSVYDAKGNKVALAPDASASITALYTIPLAPGDVTLSSTYSFTGKWYAEPDNRLSEGAYSLVNAQVGFQPTATSWKVRLWGRNLTDKHYLITLGSQSNGDFAGYGAPRTYGVTVEKLF